MNYLKEKIKNIGIFAHVDAGKTTLTEQLLYQTGATYFLGRVDNGNTVTDNLELERERGISIISMPTSYTFKGHKVNIIDTPGHVDFVAEVERSMLVLDGAILVISAKEGIQSHTKLLFNALKRMEIPTLIFVNKIDRMGVEIKKVIMEIEMQLTHDIYVMQEVIGEGSREALVSDLELQLEDQLIEILSKVDEMIMIDYLEGNEILSERLYSAFKMAVNQRKVYPVLFGSALNGIGIKEILEKINKLLPQFKSLNTDEISGVVFKVYRKNKKIKRESMIKLTAGQLKLYEYIGADKVTNIFKWNHGRVERTNILYAGDIGIVSGLYHLNVGDTFGQGTRHKRFSLGKPNLKVKVKIERPTMRQKLLEALLIMTDNDPYLSYELNEFNDDIYINLFGYVQMEIVQEMIRRDFGINIQFMDPMTIYMETPMKITEATVNMYQDALPFHAGIGLRVEPLPRGSGIQYFSEISTGDLKQPFQNGIEDGVLAYIDQGLHGWELTDLKIVLISFQFNSVDSTPKDYRDLSPLVLFEALKKVGTKLLWPISEYQLSVPTKLMGTAISDLRRMKATIEEPVIEDGMCLIKGNIPVELSNKYSLTVQEYTSGMGYFESKVIGYEDVPDGIYKERPRFKVDPVNKGKYLLAKRKVF